MPSPHAPCPFGSLGPHRGLPANVVHSHGHILHHVEAFTGHRDGPAAAVEHRIPVSPQGCHHPLSPQSGLEGLCGPGSHLTGLRRGLMAVMTGFCMYQKVRLPCTQPRRSKRTHTGTGTARAPAGTVQVMLVSVRLWGQEALLAGASHPTQPPPGTPHFLSLSFISCPLQRKLMPGQFPVSTATPLLGPVYCHYCCSYHQGT